VPWNFVNSTYTSVLGATTAVPGDIIHSSIWNNIHADLANALSTIGINLWEPKMAPGGNYLVQPLDYMLMVNSSTPQITLPPSSTKSGPVAIIGAASGFFGSNPSTVFLSSGDTFNGSAASPCFTLNANFQAQIFYPLPNGGWVNTVGNVTSFNGRSGAVTLLQSDINALNAVTTFNTRTGSVTLTEADLLNTGAVVRWNNRQGTVSLTLGDMMAIGVVTSFNTRNGTVTFQQSDLTGPGISAVTTFNGRTGAVNFTFGDLQAIGGFSNNPTGTIGSNFIVTNSQQGVNLVLGGNAFFTVSFNAVGTYNTNFIIMITNTDSYAYAGGGGRAKFISGIAYNGRAGFYLWPGQSCIVYISNATFMVIGKTRWSLPLGNQGSPFPFYVNASIGNDTWGATDGLKSTQPFASIMNTLYQLIILGEIDFNSHEMIIFLGSNTTEVIHMSALGLVGAAGGGIITLDGQNTYAILGPIQVFFGMQVQLQNIFIGPGPGSTSPVIPYGGIYAMRGSRIQIGVNVLFEGLPTTGTPAGPHIYIDDEGLVVAYANYTVAGGATDHVSISLGGNFNASGIVITVSNFLNFTDVVVRNVGGYYNGPGWSGGSMVGGQTYLLGFNSVSLNASLIPGNIAGVANTGAQFN